MKRSIKEKSSGPILTEVWTLLKENIRNYAMYVALAVIFILFNITTGGTFLTARNITNLVNQTGYVAVMAVGMTLVLIISQIDLSIGYAAGFFGAVAARLLSNGVSAGVAIILVLIGGIVMGLIQGLIVSRLGVPAFVTTLAFLFVFRGMLSLVTESTGTISVSNEFFNQLSNGFIPEVFTIGAKHGSSLVVSVLAIIALIIMEIRNRQDMKKYNFEVVSLPVFILKITLLSAFIGWLAIKLAGYNGISWTLLIVIAFTIIYHLILEKTKIGRYIYGVGGNREASVLAGIDVKKIITLSFASMGFMAALGGILFTSRLRSATPSAGAGFELDAIASCFIGGVSTTGGIGKVGNSIIGAFVIISLTNGLNLMGVGISYQYVIKGIIFTVAVAFDVLSQGKKTI